MELIVHVTAAFVLFRNELPDSFGRQSSLVVEWLCDSSDFRFQVASINNRTTRGERKRVAGVYVPVIRAPCFRPVPISRNVISNKLSRSNRKQPGCSQQPRWACLLFLGIHLVFSSHNQNRTKGKKRLAVERGKTTMVSTGLD